MHHSRVLCGPLLRGGLPALASLVLMAATPVTPPGRPEHWPRMTLDAGTLYLWDRASPAMTPIPAGPIPAGSAPLAIADTGDGRGVLLVRAATEVENRSRKRNEGEALLLAWGDLRAVDRGLTLAWTARFEGLPRAAAVASSRAWVLTARTATSDTTPARLWLHELDRTSGRIEDSAILEAPATALAADPLGRRVYLALEGRILSLTTRPLVTSWHYRSPGANRALAISSTGAILASLRDGEVALFDAAVIAHRPIEARRSLEDDATTVVPLPLEAEEMAFSEDDRLLALFGKEGFVFVEIATGALILPERSAALAGAATLHPIVFPGAERDLIVAAFPAGEVVALPAPAIRPEPRAAIAATPTAPPTAPPQAAERAPIATPPPAATVPPVATAASAAETVPTLAGAPPLEPEEAAPSGPARTTMEPAADPETMPTGSAEAAPAAATAPAPESPHAAEPAPAAPSAPAASVPAAPTAPA